MPPVVDGIVSEGEWRGAALAKDFIQYEPRRGSLSEVQTDAFVIVRANQFFTKDLFLRVFLQTNSTIERENVQAVFVYRYRPPFGTIQVAYQRGTAAFGERSEQGDSLFLKVTGVF